ncbi:unnamed protein product [Nezara viridula]|uniref:Uncharacterized protein n=1 Tax=Nezara viridula TaxID=85310 RepID=A0A9P0HG57_NEZVI|nr:unnamed protein product [Nezara viridula]
MTRKSLSRLHHSDDAIRIPYLANRRILRSLLPSTLLLQHNVFSSLSGFVRKGRFGEKKVREKEKNGRLKCSGWRLRT